MKVKLEDTLPSNKKTEMLCFYVLEKSPQPFGLGKIDSRVNKAISQSIKETEGKFGKLSIINTLGLLKAKRILIAGLGNKEKLTTDTIRDVSGRIVKKARELGLSDLTVVIPKGLDKDQNLTLSQIIEGAKLALYSFDQYKKEKQKKDPELFLLTDPSTKAKKITKEVQIISDSVNFARGVANLPPNSCNPTTLGEIAKSLAKKNKMKCTIISKSELRKKGFGGISAVGQGSKNEPRLIILEYNMGRKEEKPIVIVGKAVTFDTGGISIKPGEKMDEMKFDKCGGCTVLGIMKAVSELNLSLNLVGIIPSVENMPGGESYRPGDIVKLYNGKTSEILNTDAEGRLILADAIAYGERKFSPKSIIDFATLTGACIVALGTNVAGIITNDDSLSKKIKQSSEKTGEKVWELPLDDEYMDMIKSEIADMKNLGIGRAAGTITAAAFLRNAVEKTPWIHFDIAGVGWTQMATKEKSYNPKGATGFGIRLILNYLMNNN